MGKNTSQREIRLVWNNVQRINHQNKFVPSTVLTRSRKVQVSTSKKNYLRATASTSSFRPVNTATHTNRVNVSKLRTNDFHKSHLPIRKSFYKPTTPNTKISNEKVNIARVNGVNTAGKTAVSAVKGNGVTVVKASAGCVWRPKMTNLNNVSKNNSGSWVSKRGNPQQALKNKGIFEWMFPGIMTGNNACVMTIQDTLMEYYLFSVLQIVIEKTVVLFTETECLVLSPDFKLLDASQVLLRVPRQSNMLGHVNFKTMNKLVKGNLVRGLPSKTFENDHTCVACQKGKQHKASCKTKHVSSISQPLQMLHMDLFGPTSVRSINHKTYCLVVTDDFSRFSWVFFLATKSETSGILKKFITEIENQLNHKVKVIRSDNGTKFKNREMDEFCGQKGIKREYSVARTPQQNGVAERKNRTLIEAARTMLADSLLPTVFWAEAVNTACYVLNRVLVTKPHNKTPYKLIIGRALSISFMRPFRCPVTILNTLDPLGKFDGKAEEGFLVGYSINSKAFRVFNTETRKVEENLNQTNKNGGPQENNGNTGLKKNVDVGQTKEENVSTQQYIVFPLWSSISLSYKSLDDKAKDYTVDDDACRKTAQEPISEYDQALKNVLDKMMDQEKEATEQSDAVRKEFEAQCNSQEKITRASSTNSFNTVSTPVNTASASRTFSLVGPSSGPSFVPFGESFPIDAANLPHDPLMPKLEDTTEIQSIGFFGNAYDDHDLETLNTPYADQNVGAEANFNNMEPFTVVSPIPTIRVHSIHPKAQIIRDPKSAVQTRGMTKKNSGEHAMISYIQKQRRTNHKDFQNYLFACFLSQNEPTKISQALDDESWVEAMQEELFQFKIQKVWTLVDLPSGKKAIVAQGYKQEEGIDYDEVFAPIVRVEAIRLFLAFTSFMNFSVYHMDVKSVFLYGTIEEEVYVSQPPGFVDPQFPEKVYKVEKALYGLHQAPRAWYETLSTYLLDNGFHRGQIDKTVLIKRLKGDILLVQVYVDDIIFGSTKKPYELTNAPFNLHLPLDLTIGILLEIQSTGIFGNAYDDHDLETLNTPYADQSVGAEADFNNMEPSTVVSPIPITRVHSIHPEAQIIRIKGQVEANQVIFGPLIIYEFSGYQMDVKSDFLYENIKEEVYVCQPPGFVDPDLPEKVYKVEKALYGLHQAPRAWYETLSTYLLDNGFHRGQINKTLFIKRLKGDILLV
ncbi:zinc finger, CCHC-type containing protein [Tanacetum coccineum]